MMWLKRGGLLFRRAAICGFTNRGIKMIKGFTDHLRAKIPGDEDDFGPMIIAWPCGQGCRWMENMLHGVNGHRRIFADQIKDALNPQKAFAAHLGKDFGPGDKGIPVDRFIKGDAK